MLRLNLGVQPTRKPNRLGVLGGDLQGFPNGRRLTDDVVDIELQALEGAAQTGKIVDALAAGDKVNANDNAVRRHRSRMSRCPTRARSTAAEAPALALARRNPMAANPVLPTAAPDPATLALRW